MKVNKATPRLGVPTVEGGRPSTTTTRGDHRGQPRRWQVWLLTGERLPAPGPPEGGTPNLCNLYVEFCELIWGFLWDARVQLLLQFVPGAPPEILTLLLEGPDLQVPA